MSVKQIYVFLENKPGALADMAKVLAILREENINVEYMYAFLGGKANSAYMIFKVRGHHQAAAAMTAKGIRLVDQEELSEL